MAAAKTMACATILEINKTSPSLKLNDARTVELVDGFW
jgi:hypothetical protein